jgi:hypothetical protein
MGTNKIKLQTLLNNSLKVIHERRI